MSVLEEGPEAMDLEKPDPPKGAASSCSICLETVIYLHGRSTAKLQCGHEFHLDCIGSAFNAKGAMQCPNCRKVEKGQWLYANGHRPSTDFDLDSWVTEEVYDLSYSELPFGFQWCPIRGLTQLASLFEEGEPHSHSLYGDHSSASSSSHVCPYLPLRRFPHTLQSAQSGPNDPIPENGSFHWHPTNLGGPSAGDMINSHNLSATEVQTHNWQPQPSLSHLGNSDQATSQFASRVSRNNTSTHQRLGSSVHPHSFLHGTVAHAGSNMIPGQTVLGEGRSNARGNGSHFYQPSVPPSSLHTTPLAPVRRPRPRGLTTFSSMGPSSADIGGLYGIPLTGPVNRNHLDGESIGRDFERFGWRRGRGSTMPWIPADGESHWSAFHPNQNQASGSREPIVRHIYPQSPAGERVTQGHLEVGYYSRMPPPQMPPYM